jgi:CheY-like chemotaxis protein
LNSVESTTSLAEQSRILVVDDDEEFRELLERTLARLGAEIATSPDAASALTQLNEAASPFHTVITDLTMPGLDGCEFARELRRRDPRLNIVIITGYCREHVMREIETIERVSVIEKTEVLTELPRYLSRQRTPSEPP